MAGKYGASYIQPYQPAEDKAIELCKDCITDQEKFEAISHWLNKCFEFDGIRELHIKELTGPDIERTFNKHMGLCMDISALAVLMFRTVGLKANVVFGWVSYTYNRGPNYPQSVGPYWHAWVEVKVNGEKILYDQMAEKKNMNKVKLRKTFTYVVSFIRE